MPLCFAIIDFAALGPSCRFLQCCASVAINCRIANFAAKILTHIHHYGISAELHRPPGMGWCPNRFVDAANVTTQHRWKTEMVGQLDVVFCVLLSEILALFCWAAAQFLQFASVNRQFSHLSPQNPASCFAGWTSGPLRSMRIRVPHPPDPGANNSPRGLRYSDIQRP